MMRLYKIIPLISLTFLLIFQNSINTGCTKPQDIPAVDTIIITPPPPPVNNDTVSLVRKLDELTSLYPGYGINKERSFSFYYDAQKRLTSVGIKVYPLYVTDTFTTRLEYIGNSKFPYRIIMPAINVFSPPSYDTTWFFYAANGKLQKDSSYERWLGGPEREPFYRIYSYPDSNTAKIDWYWIPAVSANLTLMRRDTVKFNATGRLDFIKAVYLNDPIRADGAYAKAEAFTFSQIVNPLSKLNISGTPYALIYTEVKKELLGNNTHPIVFNSNGSANYLDFVSPVIPNLFYITGYNSLHQVVGQGGAAFPVEITPWSVRPSYPAEIWVRISTSLAGDRFIYRYSY